MSIYIPNVEFPKKDKYMAIVVDRDGLVYPSLTDAVLNQNKIAEAQQVMKHGRLIDADALEKCGEIVKQDQGYYYVKGIALTSIYNAPTIIEAEVEHEYFNSWHGDADL